MDFLELAKKRYSVRDFSSKKVEKEKILKILEAGKIATTAKNSQLIKIYYCTDDEKLKLLNESSPCEYNSQLMFVITYNSDECWKYEDGIPNGVVDTAIVTVADDGGSSGMLRDDLGINGLREVDTLKRLTAATFDITSNKGPIAAASPANTKITFCVAGDILGHDRGPSSDE